MSSISDNTNRMVSSFVMATPVNAIEVIHDENTLIKINLNTDAATSAPQTALGKKIFEQIKAYFAGERKVFSLPTDSQGTQHQTAVWSALTAIPFGQVETYGGLAKSIKSSARAIGGACRKNPLPIVVPCHRVVASNDIGGFSGKTSGNLISIKRKLLMLEGVKI